jgi:hypothetical protein
MPYYKDMFARTDLLNVQEYFAALQAVFDTVKESAWQEQYATDRAKLERNFKLYLEDKDWNNLVSFFMPYAEHFLLKFEELKEAFGDGKLIKSVEDLMLAAILKNYVKYDFVVGNPPYVRKEKLGDKTHFEANFPEIYHGDNDLCVYFLFRGMSWLSESGKFGYIVSGKFTKTRYGKYIRAWIPKNYHINQVIDLRGSKVFSGVAVDPIILIAAKKLTKSDDKINVVEVLRDLEIGTGEEELATILSNVKAHVYEDYSDNLLLSFDLMQKTLVGGIKEKNSKYLLDEWKLVSNRIMKVFEKIKENSDQLLNEVCDVYFGVKTGGIYAFRVWRKDVSEFGLETKLLKPVVDGENVRGYNIKYDDKYLIFPYKEEEDYKVISERELKNSYPNIYRYLSKFKDELAIRTDIIKSNSKWYELRPCKYYYIFKQEKILVPDISEKNRFAFDSGKYFCFHSVYIVLPKEHNKKLIKYFLGILNSNVTNFYFRQIGAYLGRKGYRYQKQYLERIPIRLPQTKSEQALADEITKTTEQILEQVNLEQKIENFSDEYIQEYRSRGEEFGSTNITFKSNHKAIEPVIEKTVDGRGYNIVIGKKEKPVYAESEVKANYIVTALKGKSAKKDEKKQVLIPKSDAIVEEILNKLESDKAQIKSPSVAELEDEINELVYTLYGLNENDVEVIDDFLRRF